MKSDVVFFAVLLICVFSGERAYHDNSLAAFVVWVLSLGVIFYLTMEST